MARGKFRADFGPCVIVVEGDTPFDARAEATAQLRRIGLRVDSPEAIELRFLSGFPQFAAGELRFGKEVKPGDSFPDQYEITETIVRSESDLQRVVRSWPPETVATPPFRPHASSPGSWKIPAFAESRKAISDAYEGFIESDRLAGRASCD